MILLARSHPHSPFRATAGLGAGKSGICAKVDCTRSPVTSVLCRKVTTFSKLKLLRGMNDMRLRGSLITVAVLALTTSVMSAQNSAPAAPERKIASRVAPTYPDLARKMHIHGTVRVEAVVRPNGSVKSTRVLGGNPVLVDAALDAVGKWKFEAGQNETTEVVQLAFEGQ
jgi:TonB family protein